MCRLPHPASGSTSCARSIRRRPIRGTPRLLNATLADGAGDVCAGPLDAAHVMYTSGSTGEPKGAVIPHRAVVRTVCETSYLQTGPDATFFAFVPLTFDVSILEIWGALLNG